LISFKSEAKSIVYFLNKGGRRGHLGKDLHEEEGGREWPDGRIADNGAFWREVRRVRE
jgi:hypothetical protein